MVYEIFTVVLLGALSMMAWSIMYKSSSWYRIAEDLTLGVMGGYVFYVGADKIWSSTIIPLVTQEAYSNIIPIILGLLFWLQITQKYRWIARIPLAFVAGMGTAVAMTGSMYATILVPIRAMATPPASNLLATINHLIAGVATITSIIYFFFTIKPVGILKPISKTGRFMMMIGFGSICGSAILSNTTFLYNRAQWFVFTPYAWISLAGATLIITIDIVRQKGKK